MLTVSFSVSAQMDDNSADNNSAGTFSVAMGDGTTASGSRSTAMGGFTTASGMYSTAMGRYGTASGNFSTAMGDGTTASGVYSTAMGYETTAGGYASTTMGYNTEASGVYSAAMGSNTTASGGRSTAMGGGTTASGIYSIAMGSATTASDYASVVIGQFNSSGSSATSADSFSTSSPAFVIGNGTASNAKSDAFKVMFNGNTTISGDDLTIGDLSAFSGSFSQRSAIDVVAHSDGDLLTAYASGSTGDKFNIELDTGNSLAKISSGGGYNLTLSTEGGTMNFVSSSMGPGTYAFVGDVVISSDARLKSNIVSLGSTLPKLLQIDGKSYEMKGKQKIGVLAQEIQEVFPELVSEDDNEVLAVNYQGLVPVLINALKEQNDKINRLENLVEQLISKN